MNFEKRYRQSKMLFGISLLFLIGFLSVWLRSVHQEKVEELQTEVSYWWLKSIKDIEGADFAKLILTSITGAFDSIQSSMCFPPMMGPPPFMNFSPPFGSKSPFSKKEGIQIIISDDSHFPSQEDFVFSDSSEVQITTINASANAYASHFYTQDSFSSNVDIGVDVYKNYAQSAAQFALDIDLVKTKLDSALAQTNIPIQYKVIKPTHGMDQKQSHKDRFFIETATGIQYSLAISGYDNYILKKMWFEFLMSILLLSVISIAFYHILHHLKEENRLVGIKNDLISNITHELRTPIFTVSAALEALESFNGLEDPARTKEYLSISKNELNRLSILVEKVLKTSLFEQEELQIKIEEFSLDQLIQTIANSLKLQFEKQQATLDISTIQTNVSLAADKIHITNVVYNLIDNALKYSATRAPLIALHLQQLDHQVELKVMDNGIGIPSEYLDQIFNKFFRVPQGNQHNVKGYGLGLNYVSNIIKQHQGTITVESVEGVGTTFTILLPQKTTA